MKQNKNVAFVCILMMLLFNNNSFSQPCGEIQLLKSDQEDKIYTILKTLDQALKNENLFQIDSLNKKIKEIYSEQAGLPNVPGIYVKLETNGKWFDRREILDICEFLVATNSPSYINLWKLAKGKNPLVDLTNSVMLSSAAQTALGLIIIADNDFNLKRKVLLQSWGKRALDSLMTMQLANGSFPLPDLRITKDRLYSPLIQSFLDKCGIDSLEVLQNGWIIDDHDFGFILAETGIISELFYKAYQYTGNPNYKELVISAAAFFMTTKFKTNYNYNTFASLILTRAFQLNNDSTYLERAIKILRFAVYPGQLENGRWVDGENSKSRYHNLMIQNVIPTIQQMPDSNPYKTELILMLNKAVKNMLDYTNKCGIDTDFKWLLAAFQLDETIISSNLKDSISNVIGGFSSFMKNKHAYIEIPFMGDYLDFLEKVNEPKEHNVTIEKDSILQSNEIYNLDFYLSESGDIIISLLDNEYNLVLQVDEGNKRIDRYHYKINLTKYEQKEYILRLEMNGNIYDQRILVD